MVIKVKSIKQLRSLASPKKVEEKVPDIELEPVKKIKTMSIAELAKMKGVAEEELVNYSNGEEDNEKNASVNDNQDYAFDLTDDQQEIKKIHQNAW